MNKFSVVPRSETCAVWNITPDRILGSIVEVGTDKSVRIVRQWEKPRSGKATSEFLEHFRNVPIVISLDSRLAHTAILPFKISMQADSRKDRIEFHSTLRELVNRANLETRLLAAKALDVEDLDAVLFDARVMNLKMDGKDVVGWPQLPGRKLEGYLHAMFTGRTLFNELHAVLHSGKELFVTEETKAALMVLARHTGGPYRILRADPGIAEFFVLDYRHEPVFRKMPLVWDSPLSALEEEWNISEESAREILAAYRDGGVSKSMERLLARIFASSEESFRKALQRSKFRGRIYFRGKDVLPFALPFSNEDAEVLEYPLTDIWRTFGFEGIPGKESSATLLPLLEFYYHRGDPAHHRALARQIHWIAP